MNYGFLFIFALIAFAGLRFIWVSIRQLRLNNYLRKYGNCTLAVITQTKLIRGKDRWGNRGFISQFKATYQDAQNRSYDADFSAKNSVDGHLHPVGGEVLIYYAPLHPERSALDIDVTSPLPLYLSVLAGAALFTFGLYMFWESLPQIH